MNSFFSFLKRCLFSTNHETVSFFVFLCVLGILSIDVFTSQELPYRIIVAIVYLVNLILCFTPKAPGETTTTRLLLAYATIIGATVAICALEESLTYAIFPFIILAIWVGTVAFHGGYHDSSL